MVLTVIGIEAYAKPSFVKTSSTRRRRSAGRRLSDRWEFCITLIVLLGPLALSERAFRPALDHVLDPGLDPHGAPGYSLTAS
jgi:hypothetical protein